MLHGSCELSALLEQPQVTMHCKHVGLLDSLYFKELQQRAWHTPYQDIALPMQLPPLPVAYPPR